MSGATGSLRAALWSARRVSSKAKARRSRRGPAPHVGRCDRTDSHQAGASAGSPRGDAGPAAARPSSRPPGRRPARSDPSPASFTIPAAGDPRSSRPQASRKAPTPRPRVTGTVSVFTPSASACSRSGSGTPSFRPLPFMQTPSVKKNRASPPGCGRKHRNQHFRVGRITSPPSISLLSRIQHHPAPTRTAKQRLSSKALGTPASAVPPTFRLTAHRGSGGRWPC